MLAAVFGAFALGAFGPALARADEVPTPGATQPTRGAAQPTPGAAQPTPGAADPADSAVIEGPMRPDAQELYDRGLGRFQVRDYAGATADFEAGYAIEARREFLFAEGQSKRLAGDCKGAVPLYQRFLATGPPVVQVNATHIALGRCAQLLAAHPDVVVVRPPPPPPPPPPRPPRWWQDPFGLAAAGVGVVGVGVGVGLLMAASSAEDAAKAAPTHDAYASLWATAGSRQSLGVASLVAGGTLVAAGAVRLALVRRRAARTGTLIVVSIGPGVVALGGGF